MVQPLEQQNSDQGCPDLNTQGVFAGADERLDLEVLLESLEEELNFPAVFVDRGYGSRAKLLQIGQQHDLPVIDDVPHCHASQRRGAIPLRFFAGELNELV